jgi:hypothetical protein
MGAAQSCYPIAPVAWNVTGQMRLSNLNGAVHSSDRVSGRFFHQMCSAAGFHFEMRAPCICRF